MLKAMMEKEEGDMETCERGHSFWGTWVVQIEYECSEPKQCKIRRIMQTQKQFAKHEADESGKG